MTLETLQESLRLFAKEREWEQFHSPRNLILALCGEAGELAELIQWTPDKEVETFLQEPKNAQNLRHEMADVFSYLLRLADVCNVDLEEALKDKIELNQTRYPVSLAKGSSRKYTQLKGPDSEGPSLGV